MGKISLNMPSIVFSSSKVRTRVEFFPRSLDRKFKVAVNISCSDISSGRLCARGTWEQKQGRKSELTSSSSDLPARDGQQSYLPWLLAKKLAVTFRLPSACLTADLNRLYYYDQVRLLVPAPRHARMGPMAQGFFRIRVRLNRTIWYSSQTKLLVD